MEAWRQELYLAHHGILGMKWGHRQGPPYPLDVQDHSAAEKKAGWRKSLDGGSGQESKSKKRLTKEESGGKIKVHKEKKHIPKMYSEEPEWVLDSDSSTTSENQKRTKQMSSVDVQKGKEIAKKALIVVGVTSIATITAYTLYQNRDYLKPTVSTPISTTVKQVGATAQNTTRPSPSAVKQASTIVKGLIQRNANVPIDSLGQTFNTPKEYADHLDTVYNHTAKAEQYGRLFSQSYWNGLSRAQKDAVKAYSGEDSYFSYKGMNKLLRLGENAIPEAYRTKVKELVNDCAKALEHSTTKEDAVTFRGVPKGTIAKMLGTDFTSAPLTKEMGEILLKAGFTEKGFYSSSIKESTAEAFASGGQGIKITTIIPKGTKAMYLAPISVFSGEKELLLQRGTSFKVKDFQTDAAGMLIGLVVEVTRQL